MQVVEESKRLEIFVTISQLIISCFIKKLNECNFILKQLQIMSFCRYHCVYTTNYVVPPLPLCIYIWQVRGMRAPFLRSGGNRQFAMMREFGFLYDASLVAPVSDIPLWPYTLDYRLPHRSVGTITQDKDI
jgi:hypothetical protein